MPSINSRANFRSVTNAALELRGDLLVIADAHLLVELERARIEVRPKPTCDHLPSMTMIF